MMNYSWLSSFQALWILVPETKTAYENIAAKITKFFKIYLMNLVFITQSID